MRIYRAKTPADIKATLVTVHLCLAGGAVLTSLPSENQRCHCLSNESNLLTSDFLNHGCLGYALTFIRLDFLNELVASVNDRITYTSILVNVALGDKKCEGSQGFYDTRLTMLIPR